MFSKSKLLLVLLFVGLSSSAYSIEVVYLPDWKITCENACVSTVINGKTYWSDCCGGYVKIEPRTPIIPPPPV